MTLALLELQAAMAAHVLGDDQARLAQLVVGDSISASARLRIYRHHVVHSLTAALAATFPTVRALVGETFFGGLARRFIAANPPRQPVLAEYGAEFGRFVADDEPARVLPYLADMSRLDWALNLASHAPFEPRLRPQDLAAIDGAELPSMTLSLASGAALIQSPFAIDRIWQASQPGAADEAVDGWAGPARLLVLRGADDAAFVVLSEGEAEFMAALARGQTLESAGATALSSGADFDLAVSFSRLLAWDVFAALQHKMPPTS